MERTGQPATGVAGQSPEAEGKLLRGLVDYLRQKGPELRQERATRITGPAVAGDARRRDLLEVTAVYDNYVNALETGSVEALGECARPIGAHRPARRGDG